MGIIQAPLALASQVGVIPATRKMVTTDNLATVTTAGYLNSVNLEGFPLSTNDVIEAFYSYNTVTQSGTYAQFGVSISGTGVITLTVLANPGDVLLPVVSGDFANFNGTTGQIKDSGFSPSNPAKTKVIMANGAVIANHIATYTDTAGTIGDDAATAINGGNIQAGLSGTAGTLASFPATAANGSLIVAATNAGGAFNTTISNATMGQSSVISIPDPAGATADFVLAPAALVSGNLIKASGTAGLVVDAAIVTTAVMQTTAVNTMSGSGQIILVKANGTEAANAVTASGNAGVITTSSLSAAGGSNYAITWTNTKITATSVITLTIQGGTNTTQNITFTCVPGSGTATLTIFNNTAATSLNGTILIGYTVL